MLLQRFDSSYYMDIIKSMGADDYSAFKKEGQPDTYNNMDEPGQHHVKWNKPDGERQILHLFGNRKTVLQKWKKKSILTAKNK